MFLFQKETYFETSLQLGQDLYSIIIIWQQLMRKISINILYNNNINIMFLINQPINRANMFSSEYSRKNWIVVNVVFWCSTRLFL